MWRLLYPLRYFALANTEKRRIDLWATLVLAAMIAAPFILPTGASFFRVNGFLDKLLVLTSALTGFYVAALVAAATFTNADLDKTITSGPIALVTKDSDGNEISEFLTRREFACTIFGYLAFSAFIISILSAVVIPLSESNLTALAAWKYVGIVFQPDVVPWLRGFFIIAFALMAAHLTVATTLGMYYLMDRLYRRDRQIVTKKTSRSRAA